MTTVSMNKKKLMYLHVFEYLFLFLFVHFFLFTYLLQTTGAEPFSAKIHLSLFDRRPQLLAIRHSVMAVFGQYTSFGYH